MTAKELREGVRGANLVICVLDAARQDHFGCYGYPRETTPYVDALADDSVVFEKHFTQATYTGASTNALFSGRYPWDVRGSSVVEGEKLPESTYTLARAMERTGRRTALFASNVMLYPDGPLGNDWGFQESFTGAQIDKVLRKGEVRTYSPEPLIRLFSQWIGQHGGSPFFAYIHFTPPHFPYRMPIEYRLAFAGQIPPGYRPQEYHPGEFDFPVKRVNAERPPLPEGINRYDSNLRYGDWAISQIATLLRDADCWGDTILIVTADHGESFGEHGFVSHGAPPNEEVTRVPLLIRFPHGGVPHMRVKALTETIDLFPTILDMLGVRAPESLEGHSLLPLITGEVKQVRRYAFTRAVEDGGKFIVRSDNYALILFGNGEWRGLYDMQKDPGQRRNVVKEQPQRATELIEAFHEFGESHGVSVAPYLGPSAQPEPAPHPERRTLTPETERDLRALGYLK